MSDLRERLISTKGDSSYESVLERAQMYLSTEMQGDVDNMDESELKEKITKYITDYSISCRITESLEELTNYLYHDMSGMSFISRERIFDIEGFEELNINSFEDVDIVISGQSYKTEYRFSSAQQAIDIHKRLLRQTGTNIDDSMPIAIADLGPQIRIAVIKSPITDQKIGITSSIRKVDNKTATREGLLEYGSLTEEMLDFLELASQHGVSIVFAGETGAGKTYLGGYILDKAAQTLRTLTIEEGSREWDFIKRDEAHKISNSVIHLKTRPSENPTQNINQNKLLMQALRYDIDVMGIGEMRSDEAYTAAECATTGCTVITTTHSESAADTPYRLMQLAKKAYDFNDQTLLSMITKAFPIIVYVEKLADKKRRVSEIVEVIGREGAEVISKPLWTFEVTENVYKPITDSEHNFTGTAVETIGSFVRHNEISPRLGQKMLKKGATQKQLEPYMLKVV